MKAVYLETIYMIERLHREFLEMLKAELERLNIRDINNIQAMILFNIGDEELTIGELTDRGYYLGSNVSYNVKKMTTYGYLLQQRGLHDKRSIEIRLSKKALDIKEKLQDLFSAHAVQLAKNDPPVDLTIPIKALRELEQFWSRRSR